MLLSELLLKIDVKFDGEDIDIAALNTLDEANRYNLSFMENKKYLSQLKNTKAGAVLVTKEYKDEVPSGTIAVVVENTYIALAHLSKEFQTTILDDDMPEAIIGKNVKIQKGAYISNGAVIGDNCTIMANSFIGVNAKIGSNTFIYPNVSIYHDCIIGENCIIHSGTVVGSDGFGFATNHLGEHIKIYQNGNVVIGDDVELGSNVTIDRAVFNSTIIKKGCRLDNLVHIGHNCVVGEYSVFAGQAGSAGSTTFGRNFVVGGHGAISGHINIAPFTTLAGFSGLTKSIKNPHQTLAGFPALDHRTWLKNQAKLSKILKK